MLVIHPIIQFSAIVLALYVFSLGVQRFRFLHLGQKTTFRWKRHVFLGTIAMGAWLGGMLGGVTMVYSHWHGFLITGTHGKAALIMASLYHLWPMLRSISGPYQKETQTSPYHPWPEQSCCADSCAAPDCDRLGHL